MDDLRRGPTIFVGAFDNAWTLRLTNPLRYHFANDANMMHLWIMDSAAPGPSRWMVDRGVQMATNNYRDYAIMARFTDPNTGKLAVVVAGIGRGGTRAAGEFFTDNGNLSAVDARGPRGRRQEEYGSGAEHRDYRRRARPAKDGSRIFLVERARTIILNTSPPIFSRSKLSLAKITPVFIFTAFQLASEGCFWKV